MGEQVAKMFNFKKHLDKELQLHFIIDEYYRAMWAPAVFSHENKYYLLFGANDVHEGEVGGIGIAVADQPEGPYKDLLGKPLINGIVNGAQPIDQYVFKDRDGTFYMFYGGWGHLSYIYYL